MNKNAFGLSVLLLVGCSLPAVAGFNFATVKGWFIHAPKVTRAQMFKNVVNSNLQKLVQSRFGNVVAKHPYYMFAGAASAAVLTVASIFAYKKAAPSKAMAYAKKFGIKLPTIPRFSWTCKKEAPVNAAPKDTQPVVQ